MASRSWLIGSGGVTIEIIAAASGPQGPADRAIAYAAATAMAMCWRQALKERGSLLTVEAIVEQAQAITLAVDALALSPRAAVDVAVQKEFAELGCFPE